MKRIAHLVAVVASLWGSQVSALSCLPPDVARSFTWASEAEELYLVVLGTFEFGNVPSSDTGDINAPREVEVSSRFDGQFLSSSGFTDAPPLDGTIRFECAGPWCGSMASDGAEVLAFVEQQPDGYVLAVGPCPGATFYEPTDDQLAQIVSCIKGRDCTHDF